MSFISNRKLSSSKGSNPVGSQSENVGPSIEGSIDAQSAFATPGSMRSKVTKRPPRRSPRASPRASPRTSPSRPSRPSPRQSPRQSSRESPLLRSRDRTPTSTPPPMSNYGQGATSNNMASSSPGTEFSARSFKVTEENGGERDMTSDEVNALVSNALRKARKATTSPETTSARPVRRNSAGSASTRDSGKRVSGIVKPRATVGSRSDVGASTSSAAEVGNDVLKRVEEEILLARKTANEANRRLQHIDNSPSTAATREKETDWEEQLREILSTSTANESPGITPRESVDRNNSVSPVFCDAKETLQDISGTSHQGDTVQIGYVPQPAKERTFTETVNAEVDKQIKQEPQIKKSTISSPDNGKSRLSGGNPVETVSTHPSGGNTETISPMKSTISIESEYTEVTIHDESERIGKEIVLSPGKQRSKKEIDDGGSEYTEETIEEFEMEKAADGETVEGEQRDGSRSLDLDVSAEKKDTDAPKTSEKIEVDSQQDSEEALLLEAALDDCNPSSEEKQLGSTSSSTGFHSKATEATDKSSMPASQRACPDTASECTEVTVNDPSVAAESDYTEETVNEDMALELELDDGERGPGEVDDQVAVELTLGSKPVLSCDTAPPPTADERELSSPVSIRSEASSRSAVRTNFSKAYVPPETSPYVPPRAVSYVPSKDNSQSKSWWARSPEKKDSEDNDDVKPNRSWWSESPEPLETNEGIEIPEDENVGQDDAKDKKEAASESSKENDEGGANAGEISKEQAISNKSRDIKKSPPRMTAGDLTLLLPATTAVAVEDQQTNLKEPFESSVDMAQIQDEDELLEEPSSPPVNRIEFQHPYPHPHPLPQPRPAATIIQENSLGDPVPFTDFASPRTELAQLLVASKCESMHRRSNAWGALKVLSQKGKNRSSLVCTSGFLDCLVYAISQDIPPVKEQEIALDARARAVTTLLNVSEAKSNRTRISVFHGLLDSIVKVIEDDQGEARSQACAIIATLAKTPANREVIAKTTGLVDSLSDVLRGYVDQVKGVFKYAQEEKKEEGFSDKDDESSSDDDSSYSSYEESVDSGASDPSFRKGKSKTPRANNSSPAGPNRRQQCHRYQEYLNQARVNACAAMLHLSKHCAIMNLLATNPRFMDALIRVSREFENPIHTKCVEMMCNLSRFPNNNSLMARNSALVESLVKCGKSKVLADRTWALRTFQNMSADASSKVILANSRILTLLSICSMRKDNDEQTAAVAALYNLSTEPGAVVPLTNTKNVVATLVHLAHNSVSRPEIRLMACDSLATIGMWLQTLAGSGTVPEGVEKVLLPSHTTTGWQRWD